MPQAVAGYVASAYAGATVGSFAAAASVSAATAAVYAASYAVAFVALSVGMSKISSALAGRPKIGAAMRSRTATIRSSTEYRTIVYGEARTGGVLVYANTAGNKNQWMDFVIVLAGHQVEAITDVWFDDEKIVEADINSGAAAGGAVGGAGKFKPVSGEPVAYVYKYLGTDTQTASSTLTTDYADEWTADHRLRGCAYVHIRLRRAGTTWETGAPGNFNFMVKGAKVYDPRLDTTNGGSGSHRLADPSTWAYSNNWALCVADYLIGGTVTNSATRLNWRGLGADPDDVNWPSVIAAANVADEDVDIPGSTTQKRYTADGAISTGEIPADNLEQILTAGLGQLTYASDGYRLYAGAFQTPTLSLSEADLAGEIACTADAPRADRYNAVKGVRWDAETGQEVEFLPRTSGTYETEDGAQLFREIELPFTSDEYRAQRIAQLILVRSREQETLVMHCSPSALRVGVWDTVSVTLAELGISAKTYRCLSRDEHGDDSVTLTLREEFSATYADPDVADYGDLTPATPAATPSDGLDPPTALTVRATTDGVIVEITPDPANAQSVEYEVYEYSSASPFASANLVWTGAATTVLIPRETTEPGYFWVRARRGAAVSSVYPTGDGVLGFRVLPYRRGITLDPEFEAGDLTYWPVNGLATWLSGGMYAGMARLAPNGSTDAFIRTNQNYVDPSGNTLWAGVLFGDWTIKVALRYRVNSALSGSDQRMRVDVLRIHKTGSPSVVTTDSEYIDLTSLTVGTWYSSAFSLDYNGVVSSTGSGPRPAVMLIMASTEVSAGQVDIDYCSAEIIA